jgi:uncharacterized membrane protein
MAANRNAAREKKIHLAFVISLWLKGLFALGEMVGGIFVFYVSREFLLKAVSVLTEEELTEDPHDLVANYLLHSAHSLTIGTQFFVALYLLIHGAVKFWLVVGLLRAKPWYYPVAIVVFGLFVVYQLYRFSFTHSVFLLLITGVDLVVIALTWHEYKYLRSLLHWPR